MYDDPDQPIFPKTPLPRTQQTQLPLSPPGSINENQFMDDQIGEPVSDQEPLDPASSSSPSAQPYVQPHSRDDVKPKGKSKPRSRSRSQDRSSGPVLTKDNE